MKIKSNIIVNVVGFALSALLMLVSIPVLLNGLGAIHFGILVMATAVAGLLGFLDLGISSGLIKNVSENISNGNYESSSTVLSTALLFYFFVSALIFSIGWLSTPYLIEKLRSSTESIEMSVLIFRYTLVQFCISLFIIPFVSIFKAVQRFDFATLISTLVILISHGVGAFAVHRDWVGVIGLTIIGVAASSCGLLFSIVFIKNCKQTRKLCISYKHANLNVFKKLLGFSSILTIHSLASLFFAHAQRLLVGYYLGAGAVTIFHIAFSVVSKVHLLINSGADVIFPLVSSVNVRSSIVLIHQKSLGICAIISIFILLPLGFFSYDILSLWVGNKIAADTHQTLSILCIGFFFVTLSAPTFHTLNGIGRPDINAIYSLGNCIVCLVIILLKSMIGLTLLDFAIAFSFANVTSGILYQIFAYKLLMK